MENRSTLAPISAILMTAASPASPPPTTMILGVAILLHRPSVGCCGPRVHNVGSRTRRLLEALAERVQTHQTHDAQQHEKCQARAQKPLLSLVTGNDAPLRREQP